EVRPEWKLDGVNLLPYLRGEKKEAPHEALYWRFGGQMAIRKGDWKLVKAAEGKGRTGAWRGPGGLVSCRPAGEGAAALPGCAAMPERAAVLSCASAPHSEVWWRELMARPVGVFLSGTILDLHEHMALLREAIVQMDMLPIRVADDGATDKGAIEYCRDRVF